MTSLVARFTSFRSNFLIRAWFVLLLSCVSFVFVARTTHAATLFLSPSSGSYAVGKTFTVNVLVGTAGQPANAYSGTVTYPTDKLEMTAIGKGGSIVSFWSQEPSIASGRANFEGVTFSPGYTGSGGRVVSLTFKAIAAGSAVVRFSSGAVYANDGQATNILSGMGTATFTITGPGGVEPPAPTVPTVPTVPTEVVGVPSIPKVSSTSHPDSNKWYPASTATFTWGLQNGVDAVNILADQSPNSDPGTSSDGLFSSHTYEGVKDGVWYFHLRVRNKNGWSGVSHFKFQIDTGKPDSFTITGVATSNPDQSARSFKFEAVDSGSGIDHYEVQMDDGEAVNWVDDGTHVYQTPSSTTGSHSLRVKALDKAGNFLGATATFVVEGLAPPRITEYPRSPMSGDMLIVKGTALPSSKVTIWIQKGQESPYSSDVTSDTQGKFTFISEEKLEQTNYQIWATVSDSSGNVSEPSTKLSIIVKAPPLDILGWFMVVLRNVNFYLVWIWLLLLILLYLLRKYFMLKKKLGHDVHGAQEALHKAFDLLKDDIQNQVKMLEKAKTKRELTMEENRILRKLKQYLKVAEEYIRKKIEAIDK